MPIAANEPAMVTVATVEVVTVEIMAFLVNPVLKIQYKVYGSNCQ